MERTELNALYAVSCTPRRITRENSIAVQLIDAHIDKINSTTYYLDDIIYFANLMGAAPDLEGLALIQDQLPVMLRECCRAAGISHVLDELVESVKTMISAINKYDLELQEIKKLGRQVETEKDEILFYKTPRGYMSNTPIFSVHVYGAYVNGAVRPNYLRYAFDINNFLRNIEEKVPARFVEAAQMTRFFLEAAPESSAPSFEEAVKSSIDAIAAVRGWSFDTRDQFDDFVSNIFNNPDPPESRAGGYQRTASDLVRHTDVIYLVERPNAGTSWQQHSPKAYRSYAAPREALKEGEGIDDYPEEEVVLPPPSPFQNETTSSYMPQSALNFYLQPFFWDKRGLMLNSISLIYYFLFDVYAQSWINIHIVKMLIECSLFFGHDVFSVFDMSVVGALDLNEFKQEQKRTKTVHLCYRPDRQSIIYAIPETALGYQNVTVSQKCLPADSVVELKLPDEIAESFDMVVEAFSADRIGAESHLLFPSSVRPKAHTLLKDFLRKFESRFERRITLESLMRSFKQYFQFRYGCDPVIVSYVAADFGPENRTQRFYRHLTPEEHHLEYYCCYRQFRMAIRNNLVEIPGDDDSVIPLKSLQHLKVISDFPNTNYLKDIKSFGSRVVPEDEHIKTFNEQVTTMIESMQVTNLSTLRKFHNLYTLYALILLQFGSGLRPVADLLERISANAQGKIFITDKSSGKNKEFRVNHVPQLVLDVLKQIKSGAKATFTRLSVSPGRTPEYSGQLFFFIEEDYGVVDVSPSTIRHVLKENGLSELYDFPLNCARHFMSTRLSEEGVSCELLNSWMGHQRNGKEFMNIYSTSDAKSLSQVKKIIGGILNELKFRFVKYKNL